MIEIGLYFPTAIGIKKNLLKEEQIEKILKKTYDVQQKNKSSDNLWLSGKKSPYNTIKNFNIIEHEDFYPLVSSVDNEIKNFAEFHNDYCKYFSNHAWINIYNEENFQEPHSHSYPNMYSAVFYLKTPKDSGKIVFQSPFSQYINESFLNNNNFVNDTYRYFTPEKNMLIVFKSFLNHYVLPGENKEERISIAFNYLPTFFRINKNNE
jgi:uncharacterized protein (TIGR02466 family)